MNDIEKPAALKCSGFSVRKKRGRKEEKGQRLTASVAFHEFRIMGKYVETMTDYKRNCKSEIKNGLKFNSFRESLFPHNAPHLVNISQRVEVLVIVIVEGTLEGHAVHTIGFCHKAKLFSQPKFKAVHPLQGHAKELLEIPLIYLRAVCGPE